MVRSSGIPFATALFCLAGVLIINQERWRELNSLANEMRVKAVRSFYLSVNLDPLILKGWSIARFYDERVFRIYGDIDLVFDPSMKELALQLWDDFPQRGVPADFHFGLRHLDTLPWEDIYSKTYLVDLCDVPIRVLGDEDNLRVAAVHWLTDGGVNKEKLWDIYYLVKNRRRDFDWYRCLEANGPIRKTWVLAAISTARDYLGLDVSTLPIDVQKFRLPKWYIRTLEVEWRRGPYPRRRLANVVTKPKLFFEQVYRRFPPNRIAAAVDAGAPINNSSRIPSQVRSLLKKVRPFIERVKQRIAYSANGRNW